jgi:FxsC-like protein
VIDDIARSLAVAVPYCTAEEIADILWLARLLPAEPGTAEGSDSVATALSSPGTDAAGGSGLPENGRAAAIMPQEGDSVSTGRKVPAIAVGLRSPSSVRRPLSTARALSLFKRISSPGPAEIDIDATVEATADARRLTIVTNPGRERGLDVALIADTSPVMSACQNLLTEFETLLIQAGAFRSVSRWTLVPGTEVTIRDHARSEHPPTRLIDPSGRRLVLLVTDATADHWYSPAIWQTLRRWAEMMPTAVVHILPERYRAQGPLGGDAITMRSRRPGDANRAADVEVAWWAKDPEPDDTVPIPVFGLHPSALAVWARAVVTGSDWVDAVWASQPQGSSAREANIDLSTEDKVRAFQSQASRGAQALARILAGAPIVSLPLIGMLQARLLPHTGVSELAEVLVSGLLEQVNASSEVSEKTQFRFRPSAGELLARGITATQEWDTFEAITDYLEQHAGTGNSIHLLMPDPEGLSSVDAELEPFAALGQSVAARLGLAPVVGANIRTGQPSEHTEEAANPSSIQVPAPDASVKDEVLERALTHEDSPNNERQNQRERNHPSQTIPGRPDSDIRPYFFLSYARTPMRDPAGRENPDRWVHKLYQDLRNAILQMTDVQPAEAGFMDVENKVGAEWSPEVIAALKNCRVFVPLYSRRYFESDNCGREWFAFARREVIHRARGGERVDAIVPALWTRLERDRIPAIARTLQYAHPELGERYCADGFYGIIKLRNYRSDYQRAVYRLAERIIEVGDKSVGHAEHDVQQMERNDFQSLQSAFGPTSARQTTDGNLQISVLAPSVSILPAGRNTNYYGSTSASWRPFQPEYPQPIAEYALDLARKVMDVSPFIGTLDKLRESRENGRPTSPTLVLVDPWVAIIPEYKEQLKILNENEEPWVSVLIAWSSEDQGLTTTGENLREMLNQHLGRKISAVPRPCRMAGDGIPTIQDLGVILPEMAMIMLKRFHKDAADSLPDEAVSLRSPPDSPSS